MLPLINIFLRASTLLAKFLLVFLLARFLTPGEVGIYGLLAATVGYALYAVGLDFYAYSTRELLTRERTGWGGYLKSQAVLCVLLYGGLAPVALVVFAAGWLPWALLPWFVCLLVLEHLNQELMRLLITCGYQLIATLSLFLRSGLWAIVVALMMMLDPAWRTLEHVFQAWVAGAAFGVVAAVWQLSRLGIGGWHASVDWPWLRRGIAVAAPMLVATLSLRALFTLDRYWFQALVDLDTLGAYVLFASISTALVAFLDAGVFAFSYPALIKAYHAHDPVAFVAQLKKLLSHTVLLSLGFVLCALALISPLLSWLDKPLYVEHGSLFPWLLAGTCIYGLGMVPHYALYAQSLDKPIIQSHVLGLAVFVILGASLSPWLGGLAVPVGGGCAFVFILCWKVWSFLRLTPAPFRSFRPVDRQDVI